MLFTSLDDLPGIGPVTHEKLNDCGIFSLDQLVQHEPAEVARKAEIGTYAAEKIILAAREALGLPLRVAEFEGTLAIAECIARKDQGAYVQLLITDPSATRLTSSRC